MLKKRRRKRNLLRIRTIKKRAKMLLILHLQILLKILLKILMKIPIKMMNLILSRKSKSNRQKKRKRRYPRW